MPKIWSILAHIWPKYFFQHLDHHHHVLDIMPVYHHMQNWQKIMTQFQENGQKPHFGLKFDHLGHFGPKYFFFQKSADVTDRLDRLTDGADFIGPFPPLGGVGPKKVEHPKVSHLKFRYCHRW